MADPRRARSAENCGEIVSITASYASKAKIIASGIAKFADWTSSPRGLTGELSAPTIPVTKLNTAMSAGRALELGQQTTKERKPCAPASGRGACSIQRLNLVDPSPKEIRHLFGNLFFHFSHRSVLLQFDN